MIFFTSDNHFGHFNVIKYCNRPFTGLDEMHNIMINNWNKKVGPKDTVYHLGDLFLSNDLGFIDSILGSLNGNIILLPGNHDKWIHKYERLYNTSNLLIGPDLKEMKFQLGNDSISVTMCHYPMLRWNKAHYGAINLHGHSHGGLDEYNKAQEYIRYDVGVDSNNFTPITFEEICRFNREKIEKFQSGQEFDHHKEI